MTKKKRLLTHLSGLLIEVHLLVAGEGCGAELQVNVGAVGDEGLVVVVIVVMTQCREEGKKERIQG